jgi:outer membrane lipoprotein-sorting protein
MVPIRPSLEEMKSAQGNRGRSGLDLEGAIAVATAFRSAAALRRSCVSRVESAGEPAHSGTWRQVGVSCFLWVALCVAAAVCRAADPDLNPLFDRWFAAQTNIQCWSADFTQTRTIKTLAQPLVSSGKVWVAMPGRFRWELGQPPQTIALRQPDQMMIFYPRLKRAEKYALGDVPPGPLKDALSLLDVSFPRDREGMEARFKLLSAMETNSILQMTLQPKSAAARKFIGEIVVGFRTNDFAIAVTEMRFADGSSMRNDFTHVVLNQPIPPGTFEEKLSPDISIVEPLRK